MNTKTGESSYLGWCESHGDLFWVDLHPYDKNWYEGWEDMNGNPIDDCNPVPKKETKSFEKISKSKLDAAIREAKANPQDVEFLTNEDF